MKIARYKHLDCRDLESLNEVVDWIEGADEYLRLTEITEVEFIDLPADEVLGPQVDALNKAKKAAHIAHQAVIANIDDQIGKLLAITHEDAA